jgi:hypothetical protein
VPLPHQSHAPPRRAHQQSQKQQGSAAAHPRATLNPNHARVAYRDYWDQEHQRRSALHQQIGLRGNDLDELDFIESLKHRDLMKVLGVFQDTLRHSRIEDFTAAAFD